MLWFGKKKDNGAGTVAPAAVQEASVPASSHDEKKIVLKAPTGNPPAPVVQPASAPVPAAPAARPQMNQKTLYYNLMNAMYDAVLVVDDNGHLMDCNERVADIFGYTREDAWDMPLTQLIPGVNARVFAQMKDGLHGNRRVLINARCLRKDGTTFHGEVGAGLMVLRGENLVLTIRNIEKRSPAKAIIRAANVTKPPAEQ